MAGLALASRPTYWTGTPSSSSRRGDTNVHAPMFCDSSWTQTHSRADWYRVSDGAQQVDRPGVELLDADDGDVALAADFGAPGGQVVVDLAGAEEDPAARVRARPGRRSRRENDPTVN